MPTRAASAALGLAFDRRPPAAQLGAGVRRALEKVHDWTALATDTLALARATQRRR